MDIEHIVEYIIGLIEHLWNITANDGIMQLWMKVSFFTLQMRPRLLRARI